jgi:hypothetical protein
MQLSLAVRVCAPVRGRGRRAAAVSHALTADERPWPHNERTPLERGSLREVRFVLA